MKTLFSEKESAEFDQLELEFIQDRLKGAKKLVKILIGREESIDISEKEHDIISVQENIIENVTVKEKVIETEKSDAESEQEEESKEPVQEMKVEIREEKVEIKEEIVEIHGEVELEEETLENPNKRLGDVFLKEKSVNDLLADTNKLENILSNRPVTSIQSAIGINDRFQYIRELFEGNADEFARTVEQLDKMTTLKDAVQYLQGNYKWKKNETSLKFVNLVKRRFPND